MSKTAHGKKRPRKVRFQSDLLDRRRYSAYRSGRARTMVVVEVKANVVDAR